VKMKLARVLVAFIYSRQLNGLRWAVDGYWFELN
jgi:hypothetical protein